VALGGNFLEYGVIPAYDASKYSIELIELGIGAIVAGVIAGLFFTIAAGIENAEPIEESVEDES
jgi:multicomponent Na+:H+ antiporter subunit B